MRKSGVLADSAGQRLPITPAEPAVTLGSSQAGTGLTLAERGKPKRVITP